MEPQNLSRYISTILKIRKIVDISKNGLQINSKKEITKIAVAVDATLETFEIAKKTGCNFLIVHHGLFWKGQRDELGLRKKRIDYLKENNISLYAAHLPLDLHLEYGNNIELSRILSLKKIQPFGDYNGIKIGFKGEFSKSLSIKSIAKKIDQTLNSKSKIFAYGKKQIKTIGIISGGAASHYKDAYKEGLDCYLTGEALEYIPLELKDLKYSAIISGHYHTETTGIRALGSHLCQKFLIPVIFLDMYGKPRRLCGSHHK